VKAAVLRVQVKELRIGLGEPFFAPGRRGRGGNGRGRGRGAMVMRGGRRGGYRGR